MPEQSRRDACHSLRFFGQIGGKPLPEDCTRLYQTLACMEPYTHYVSEYRRPRSSLRVASSKKRAGPCSQELKVAMAIPLRDRTGISCCPHSSPTISR